MEKDKIIKEVKLINNTTRKNAFYTITVSQVSEKKFQLKTNWGFQGTKGRTQIVHKTTEKAILAEADNLIQKRLQRHYIYETSKINSILMAKKKISFQRFIEN